MANHGIFALTHWDYNMVRPFGETAEHENTPILGCMG